MQRWDSEQMTASTWTEKQWAAVWLWLYERVVPLAIEDDNGQGIQGCGQLLKVGTGTYLVTAAHVFEDIDPTDIGIPLGPYSTHFTRLGTGSIRTTKKTVTADIDVAIFPMPSEVLTTLTWRQIPLDNLVAVGPEASPSEYLFFGYPDKLVIHQGDWLHANPVLVRTSRYRGAKTYKKFHPLVNLLLQYGDKATGRNGQEQVAPNLHGISGTPVFEIMPSRGPSNLWSCEALLGQIAIETHYTAPGSPNRYVISTL
jgi:hypothetical protein